MNHQDIDYKLPLKYTSLVCLHQRLGVAVQYGKTIVTESWEI